MLRRKIMDSKQRLYERYIGMFNLLAYMIENKDFDVINIMEQINEQIEKLESEGYDSFDLSELLVVLN